MTEDKYQFIKNAILTSFKRLIFVAVVYLCISNFSYPVTELGSQIFSGVITACILGLLFALIHTYMYSQATLFPVTVWGITTVIIIGFIAGKFLDPAIENPIAALVVIISIFAFWIVYRLSLQGSQQTSSSMVVASGTAVFRKQEPLARKPTEQDRNTIAAHEAGHAMIYAALGNLPDDFHVRIKKETDSTNSLGYVSGLRDEHTLNYKIETEWFMLVLLAGKMGEINANKNESLGAINDMRQWLDLATQYLSNQYKGIFYTSPSNDIELTSNKEEIQKLKREQNIMLEEFFTLNVDVHKELTTELLEKGLLRREQLLPFLLKVKFPENFPLLPHLVRGNK
ncbi:TPA: hypothetical protein ACJJY6_003620 [Enterobacter hormaechei subsp. xiangfangensis]|nr:hypothetical protein [Salmonella enterica]EKX3401402.1 hypothetical protein [Escherichia coli]